MKAKLKCKIDSIIKNKESVEFKITSCDGKVDTKMVPAQFIELKDAVLILKPAIADQIKIGSTFYIELFAEEPQI